MRACASARSRRKRAGDRWRSCTNTRAGALLAQVGIAVPRGGVAATPGEAGRIAAEIGGPVVVKAQAWVTERAALGAIRFAEDAGAAAEAARHILGLEMCRYTVEQVLVEERLAIAREFYAGVIVDDQARAPVMIFSSQGGIGHRGDRARASRPRGPPHRRHPPGLRDFEARELARRGRARRHAAGRRSAGFCLELYDAARRLRRARRRDQPAGADRRRAAGGGGLPLHHRRLRRLPPSRAGHRHRPRVRPPAHTRWSALRTTSRSDDYRGTFYFIQMAEGFASGEGYVGFHGAGGGGSMMSMDALQAGGFASPTSWTPAATRRPARSTARRGSSSASRASTATSPAGAASPVRSSSIRRAAGQGVPGGAAERARR